MEIEEQVVESRGKTMLLTDAKYKDTKSEQEDHVK